MSLKRFRYRHPLYLVVGAAFVYAGMRFGWEAVSRQAGWQILLPMVGLVVGVCLLLFWLNARVELDEQGIVGYGMRGVETFRSRWDEISELKLDFSDDGAFLRLRTGSNTLTISEGIRGWREVRSIVKSKLPQMPGSP